LNFENQLAHYAALPYWLSSRMMMFGATAHSEQIPMQVLRTLFSRRFISHFLDNTSPTHLPDFVTPAYFLWGYVTYKVYEICSTDTDDLRQ
jgi:hypothetical protein